MKKIILLALLPITIIMAGTFVMTEGSLLKQTDSSTPISSPIIYDKEVTVNSIEELENTVANANVPTKIILQDGIYNSRNVTLKGNSAEVYIASKNRNQAIFQTLVLINGNNITIDGFLFNGGAVSNNTGGNIINRGDDNRVTRCTWDDSKSHYWLRSLSGYRFEISYNMFKNKTNNANITQGLVIAVYSFMNDTTPREHYIHHNHFKDTAKGQDSNGYETIMLYSQVSPSDARQPNVSYGIDHNNKVTYNLLERNYGEGELICNKSCGSIIEHNTIKNSKGGISLRYGRNASVGYNFLIDNTHGIVIHDANQHIYNNYIVGVPADRSAIRVRDGGDIRGVSSNFNIHDNYVEGGRYNIRFGQDLIGWSSSASGTLKNNIFIQDVASQVLSTGKVDISLITSIGNKYFGTSLGDNIGGFIKLSTMPALPLLDGVLTANDTGPDTINYP